VHDVALICRRLFTNGTQQAIESNSVSL